MPADIRRPPILAKPKPSVRYSYESCAISRDGNWAISTEISSTTVQRRTACSKAGTLNTFVPSAPSLRKAIRFSEARLHAVSSRNMYSEHGLEARMSPPAGQVCQPLMVEWNWMPGSAQDHAAYEI